MDEIPDEKSIKEKSDDTITILIDTEGLNSSERTSDVDLKIFAITALLSSSFIFN